MQLDSTTLGKVLQGADAVARPAPVVPYFQAESVDDLTRHAIETILLNGVNLTATKGLNRELLGVVLQLTNPRARLSRTETRGKLFSALGELCWYLDGADQLEFIEYYISKYRGFADESGKLSGAYGPRLFCWNGINQFSNVARLLKKRGNSRRAVMQLFSRHDITNNYKDVACTCTLQFFLRSGHLSLHVYMRSNDVFVGLSHDIFCFTMLQEIMARCLDVELGSYMHIVGSLHLYDKDREAADLFLDEGWQQTGLSMPAMPKGNPWPSICKLLRAEQEIRSGNVKGFDELMNCKSYWKDLGRFAFGISIYQGQKYQSD